MKAKTLMKAPHAIRQTQETKERDGRRGIGRRVPRLTTETNEGEDTHEDASCNLSNPRDEGK